MQHSIQISINLLNKFQEIKKNQKLKSYSFLMLSVFFGGITSETQLKGGTTC